MIVPPLGSVPRMTATPSGMVAPSSTPFQPSRNPTISSPWTFYPLRTTARITAFRPGQSPPPVSTPTLMRLPPFRPSGSATLLTRLRPSVACVAVVIAVDAGTTGVRSFAIDENGTPLGWAYREFTQYYPQPGWVEHDADEIWDAVQTTLGELQGKLDQPVVAIGITDQRETTVAWDKKTGRPRHRAIVWQDRRTADRCRALEGAGHLPLVRERTGLVLDPYFSATKLEWLLTEGGVEADANLAFGTVDSWVLWNLIGAHVTDPSNASRTLLYDIRARDWSDELCELFGVPRSCLPEGRPSSGRLGVCGGWDDGV